MHRKCLYTLKVTVLLVFLCLPAYANTPELDQAMNYINQEQFEQAAAIYNSLLDNQPDKETEILALGGLIVIDIHQGDTEIAVTLAEQLIADNPANEVVTSAVFDIAYAFLNAGEPNESRQYYRYIVYNWPECEDAILAEFGLIRCDISSGNIQEADTALDNLLLNLPAGEDFSAQLTDTAAAYQEAGRYDSARQLYQYVLDNFPHNEEYVLCLSGLARLDILSTNEPNVQMHIATLLVCDVNIFPYLTVALLSIAEQYYEMAFKIRYDGNESDARVYFKKCIDICEIIISEHPEHYPTIADTYYLTGICYQQLEQYETSNQYFRTIIESWPDYNYVWDAQFMINNQVMNLQRETSEESEPISDSELADIYGGWWYSNPYCVSSSTSCPSHTTCAPYDRTKCRFCVPTLGQKCKDNQSHIPDPDGCTDGSTACTNAAPSPPDYTTKGYCSGQQYCNPDYWPEGEYPDCNENSRDTCDD